MSHFSEYQKIDFIPEVFFYKSMKAGVWIFANSSVSKIQAIVSANSGYRFIIASFGPFMLFLKSQLISAILLSFYLREGQNAENA